ncbi:FliH/SctL family protein [Botrimarina sp.]|uniref:FliH/SctL family protein n=1 Tax=Botrimarina sp. TaxID=2795802 RepID=UPI0032ED54E6
MATIIRRNRAESAASDPSPQPVEFRLSDMAARGERYVADVRGQAARVVEEARAEADAIRAQARADGLAEAESEIGQRLTEQIARELSTLRPALDSAVEQLGAARGEWLEHWRASAVGLAVAIAERVVRRELRSDVTISQSWLEEALRYAAGASEITVRLAPSDFDHLRGHGERLAEATAGLADARFVADEAVAPGGCRVETRHGQIDQQLATQLARLEEELLA